MGLEENVHNIVKQRWKTEKENKRRGGGKGRDGGCEESCLIELPIGMAFATKPVPEGGRRSFKNWGLQTLATIRSSWTLFAHTDSTAGVVMDDLANGSIPSRDLSNLSFLHDLQQRRVDELMTCLRAGKVWVRSPVGRAL